MTEAAQWRTEVGHAWAEEWLRTDRSFAGVSAALDAAILDVAPGTGAALDIGCGAGSTSLALARARAALAVTGIDLSPDLIAVANERGAGIENVRFQIADAADPAPPILGGAHDLAVSRHGVMFFAHPKAAFETIRSLLKPGAPFVFSCFQSVERNPWASRVAEAITGEPMAPTGDTPGPFAFADRDYVSALLTDAGWSDLQAQDLDYRYVAGQGQDPVEDALSFLSRIGPAARALSTLSDAARPAARARLRALLAQHVDGEAVAFSAAAWIWSVRA
jgi:SAM-dependent methyltransferase